MRGAIRLNWKTASEIDNLGFNLYRATWVDGSRTKINAELISSVVTPDGAGGAVYEYLDNTVKRRTTYYYWLEEVGIRGNTGLHGPVEARAR